MIKSMITKRLPEKYAGKLCKELPPFHPLHDGAHASHVTKMALTMFDQWKPLHRMHGRERKLLMTSALLHDAGMLINYYSHARHSAYLTANARIFGLSHKEQIMCAFIVAFHHGYSRKFLKNNPYTDMLEDEDWDTVRQLACFLQLAEALDEANDRAVEKIVCSGTSPFGGHARIFQHRQRGHSCTCRHTYHTCVP